jgi:hypothetical protein
VRGLTHRPWTSGGILVACAAVTAWLAASGCGDDPPATNVTPASGGGGATASSASGQGGQGGQGASLGCQPGTTVTCYEGPPATEGVGECAAGSGVCNVAGDGVVECQSQTAPRNELCTAAGDEDCDGTSNNHCPSLGINLATTAATLRGFAVAPDDGTLVVVGESRGVVDVAGTALDCSDSNYSQTFIAKLDASGMRQWATCNGGPVTHDRLNDVAVAAGGTTYVTGYYGGSADFGTGLVTTTGSYDALLLAMDASGGVTWMRTFGGTGNDYGTDVALAPDGDLALAAIVTGNAPITPFATTLNRVSGLDVVVAKLDNAGTEQWAQLFGSNGNEAAPRIATTPESDVVVAFQADFSIDLQGTTVEDPHGGRSVMVFRLAADTGQPLWWKVIGGNLEQNIGGVAADASGVYVAGTFDAVIDFGDGKIPATGARDLFLAKLDPATGDTLWARTFGAEGETQLVTRMALGPDGSPTLVGMVRGEIDFGDGPMAAGTEGAAWLGRFDPDGGHLWSRSFASAALSSFSALDHSSDGTRVIAGGNHDESLELGSGTLSQPGMMLVDFDL